MQHQRHYHECQLSRSTFRKLVTLWLTIVFVTFTAALLIATSAKAGPVMSEVLLAK